jgi:hypothetical protein
VVANNSFVCAHTEGEVYRNKQFPLGDCYIGLLEGLLWRMPTRTPLTRGTFPQYLEVLLLCNQILSSASTLWRASLLKTLAQMYVPSLNISLVRTKLRLSISQAVRSQITEAQKIAGGSGSEQDIAEAKIELEASFPILDQHVIRSSPNHCPSS